MLSRFAWESNRVSPAPSPQHSGSLAEQRQLQRMARGMEAGASSVAVECSPSKRRADAKKEGVLLAALNADTKRSLSRYDTDGNGNLDAEEVSRIVEALANEQFRGKWLRNGLLALVLSTVVLIGCLFGIVWGVVLANKETEVRGNTLYIRKSDTPAQLSSADFAPGRASVLTARSGGLVTTTGLSQELPLTADLTADQLRSLHRVHLSGSNGARVGLRVRGVTVVTQQQALHIATYSGTLVVKGGQLSADSVPAGLIASAGVEWQAVTGVFNA